MRRALYLLPMALFLVLVGYFTRALRPGYDPHDLPSALIDKPAPAFDLAGLDGAPGLDRTAFAGRVVLVNFFASWCIPCRLEQPLLMGLASETKTPLYGIAYKDKPADTAQYLAQLGNPYRRVGLDEAGRVGIDFGVYGVPETYVIDRAGRIRLRYVGPLSEEDVTKQLLPLLKKLGRS
ncbi:MAG TPA: DsbE family thiol:disulfide interchange protein [Stellaceae bacterium]|nr:DsbE family thiol:disulfide interchange protein [Stellaceae bacterium]